MALAVMRHWGLEVPTCGDAVLCGGHPLPLQLSVRYAVPISALVQESIPQRPRSNGPPKVGLSSELLGSLPELLGLSDPKPPNDVAERAPGHEGQERRPVRKRKRDPKKDNTVTVWGPATQVPDAMLHGMSMCVAD